MLRQASSRNQRTKGFRLKHALQIFLLVAVCVWLLYQVKHSRDKNRAFEERNSKILSEVVESEPDFLKFGRKDLPRSEKTGSVNETHKEEENEEEEKQEETDDEEGRGAGDDEIDEQDQEKAYEEDEHGEELAEEDKVDQVDEMDWFDNQDHEGGSQEAREENYKRDDASSAVVHDIHETESENGNGDARSLNEEQIDNMGEKDVEAENAANETVDGSKVYDDSSVGTVNGSMGNTSDIVVRENVTMPNDLSMNGNAAENRELEVKSSNLDNGSDSNSTLVESNNQGEVQNNFTVVDSVSNGVPLQNDTVIMDSVQDRNPTVDREDEPNSENAVVEPTEKSNTTAGLELEEQSTTSSATNENGDAAQEESDGLSYGMITEEERDARTDLSTLPDIQNEAAKNADDEAAEM